MSRKMRLPKLTAHKSIVPPPSNLYFCQVLFYRFLRKLFFMKKEKPTVFDGKEKVSYINERREWCNTSVD